jgi:hypothetical protein
MSSVNVHLAPEDLDPLDAIPAVSGADGLSVPCNIPANDQFFARELKGPETAQVFGVLGSAFSSLRDELQQKTVNKFDKVEFANTIAPMAISPSIIDNKFNLPNQVEEIKALASQLSPDISVEKSREVLYCIYSRIAEAIGRNSTSAVKADTINRIESLASMGLISGHVARKENPEEYIEVKILPLLDPDMRKHAYDMNIYRSAMRNFYQVLGSWRSRGRAKKVFAGK